MPLAKGKGMKSLVEVVLIAAYNVFSLSGEPLNSILKTCLVF